MGDNVPVTRRRWWLAGIALVVLIAAGGVLTWRQLHPSRPAVAAVVPQLDSAISGAVAAVGDSAAVTVTGVVPSTSCNGGSLYTLTADFYTNPGDEDAVIDRIAASLPATMRPSRSTALNGGAASLNATLSGGGTLQVIQLDAGWVAATATTGCRSGTQSLTSPTAPPDGGITTVLTGLGTAPTTWHSDAVACASGDITTVSTASTTADVDKLGARLQKLVPPGAIVFTSPSDRLSWRVGQVSTVIAAADSGTHLTAQTTTAC